MRIRFLRRIVTCVPACTHAYLLLLGHGVEKGGGSETRGYVFARMFAFCSEVIKCKATHGMNKTHDKQTKETARYWY